MSKTEPSTIKVEKGLSKITFEDDYKQQCSLQNSNAVLENKIWLGVDKDINGTAVNARMHLTKELVKICCLINKSSLKQANYFKLLNKVGWNIAGNYFKLILIQRFYNIFFYDSGE